ncbi:bis(5'-adenosyl)-triphosphatase [Cryptococcus deuterogattii 99/473]|uniref:Bis(5'-adenosyl)-triphosphatase n=1 Tax=Cryptococcus deuterogattii Ram5 TaxID=1296110 RepID=A0A0D0V598_9TREE|nr:bis(5'-adenosyl)-triphosphatase [Cryptococcus deuterogattii MMRL2647]KIR40095.1 bis(5'-adenosyl)-triphosphatase [Cryptococcus deuterogattii Ram5]KIY55866.1 bis(5'-adenosyl)-triphosphatase [Cryptococcus deuterogattii 99/473]
MSQKQLFAAFDVSRQVRKFSIDSLLSLCPFYVLIVPKRVVPRLADLEAIEVSDLFLSVQHIGKVLEDVYKARAMTVSLQDGVAAGQSVPHVHIHLIPRHPTDYDGKNDQIYPLLEQSENRLHGDLKNSDVPAVNGNAEHDGQTGTQVGKWEVPKDEDRKPRSTEEMEREAIWLASFFQKQQ